MKVAVENLLQGTTAAYPGSYSQTAVNLGSLIQQKTGATALDKFIGPVPIALARPMEESTAIPVFYPHIIAWSSNIYWIFLAEATTTGAATRRVIAYTYTKSTSTFAYKGYVTLTYPTGSTHTIQGHRVAYRTFSTGTISSVTNAAQSVVTGSGTAWVTNKICGGARIGFGSTDPTQISTWYYIGSAVGTSGVSGETTITLTGTAPSFSGSYVIEELTIIHANRNGTATSAGLFVIKGINWDDFQPAGLTILSATTVDLVKACYWLKDAASPAMTASCGIGLTTPTDANTHWIYVINADGAASMRVYKYNIRQALTLTSGAMLLPVTAGYQYTSWFKTGAQATTGNISTTNCCRLMTLNHGPGAGVSCIYGATASRVFRIPESAVIDSGTQFIADNMVELPPGSVNTFAATGGLTSVEDSSVLDRLYITAGSGQRHYCTRYNPTAATWDIVWSSDNKQIDQSTASTELQPYPSTVAGGFSIWAQAGLLFAVRNGQNAQTNTMYAFPAGAHWDFASTTGQRLICPMMSTIGATRFYRLYINAEEILGGDNLGIAPEPYRAYIRTSGISDDSGTWQLINDTGDLTSIIPGSQIQVMIEFKTLGMTCVPDRIFGVCITYEDNSTDSHYQPSVKWSDRLNKKFAWRFATAWGGTVPTLTVKLYDAVTGNLLLTDTTAAQAAGTFDKTTDDSNWVTPYNTTDKGNETTYIRYTPSSLADNVKVRAIITQ